MARLVIALVTILGALSFGCVDVDDMREPPTATPTVATPTPDVWEKDDIAYIVDTGGDNVAVRHGCREDMRDPDHRGRGIPEGAEVTVIREGEQTCAEWVWLRDDRGRKSWVHNDYLSRTVPRTQAPSTPTPTVQASIEAVPASDCVNDLPFFRGSWWNASKCVTEVPACYEFNEVLKKVSLHSELGPRDDKLLQQLWGLAPRSETLEAQLVEAFGRYTTDPKNSWESVDTVELSKINITEVSPPAAMDSCVTALVHQHQENLAWIREGSGVSVRILEHEEQLIPGSISFGSAWVACNWCNTIEGYWKVDLAWNPIVDAPCDTGRNDGSGSCLDLDFLQVHKNYNSLVEITGKEACGEAYVRSLNRVRLSYAPIPYTTAEAAAVATADFFERFVNSIYDKKLEDRKSGLGPCAE